MHSALEHCVQARAERERAFAGQSQASRRFHALRGLAKAWIFDLPATLHQAAGSAPTRALLVKTALAYLDGLAKEAGDDPVWLRETAVAYGRVGDLQAESTPGHPGDVVGALATYRKGLELFTLLVLCHTSNDGSQEPRTK